MRSKGLIFVKRLFLFNKTTIALIMTVLLILKSADFSSFGYFQVLNFTGVTNFLALLHLGYFEICNPEF